MNENEFDHLCLVLKFHTYFSQMIWSYLGRLCRNKQKSWRISWEFYAFSGQKINTSKSKLFVSRNVWRNLAVTLSKSFDIPLTSNLGTYLVIPLILNWVSRKAFGYIIEKVRRWLCDWKAKTLSRAAKSILIQTTTHSILHYASGQGPEHGNWRIGENQQKFLLRWWRGS